MSSVDEIGKRVEELSRRHREATARKSKLSGKLEEKKSELIKLTQEIKAAGYDPKTLKVDKERLEQELTSLIEAFERDLSRVEESLDAYEK